MANFKTHFIVGAAVGASLNLMKQSVEKAATPSRDFDWGELLTWTAVGAGAASLPDLLEPALNPNHRGFFHSFAIGFLILYAIFGGPLQPLQGKLRDYLRLTGFGYLSHLALDIVTPMGLPLF
ncbi:MAG TPA: metal-dependent hydrolase [Terriglobales bacterium]|jgi:membrane-bound metal-dependent hydrolase YbcI (DUF457 family)|nr:metal-dependent hydrolase [Terriglobales bacterium]